MLFWWLLTTSYGSLMYPLRASHYIVFFNILEGQFVWIWLSFTDPPFLPSFSSSLCTMQVRAHVWGCVSCMQVRGIGYPVLSLSILLPPRQGFSLNHQAARPSAFCPSPLQVLDLKTYSALLSSLCSCWDSTSGPQMATASAFNSWAISPVLGRLSSSALHGCTGL